MRLWTLHPKYLDARGLVALWREALLAQSVLRGQARGYVGHPQLIRFRESPSPPDSIAYYLHVVHAEAMRRGYRFDRAKFACVRAVEPIPVTAGQLDHEWAHLKEKLCARAPVWLAQFETTSRPDPHPLFCIVPGPIAVWEVRGRK